MCGHTWRDRIRNEDIRDKVRMTSVVDKMREVKLKIVQACEEEMHVCPSEKT